MKRKFSKAQILTFSLGFCVILAAALLCIFLLPQKKDVKNGSNLSFEIPDYQADIFQNKAYMSFQRNLLYGAMGVEQLYAYPDDLESASAECRFFLAYFNTVVFGEYQAYPDYFVEGYFKQPPKFTMQMIYEPHVMFHSTSQEENDGENVTLYNFDVSYKIFKNNGTFRDNVPSNTAVPQIYQLMKDAEGTYRILRILEVEIS